MLEFKPGHSGAFDEVRNAPRLLGGGLGDTYPLGLATGAGGPSQTRLFSPREQEVLKLLADGLDATTISRTLGLSVHTTRDYLKSIRRKLGVNTQLAAVVTARRMGLV